MPGYNKGSCTSMFNATLFLIAELWKQLRCPSNDEWIKKCIYTQCIQPQRRMKFCHFQVNAWNWRTWF
jgi:agmatine/peptidylarginine deiminase